jgi:hypothetical protein
MTPSPHPRVNWVPHVRDSFIVANVGIGTFVEAPTHLPPAETSKAQVAKTSKTATFKLEVES